MKKQEDSEESELEKEVSESNKKEDTLEEQDEEKEEDFEIQQHFIESFNSPIEFPDFSESILERIRRFNPDNLERDVFTTPSAKSKDEDYEEKYKDSNYFENKYDKKIPDYTSRSSSAGRDVKQNSDANPL